MPHSVLPFFTARNRIPLGALMGALLLAGLFATPALAHGDHMTSGGNSLLTGFLHPIFGLDHVLALLAVGIWGTVIGGTAIWALPVAFPLVMAVGAVLGLSGVPLPAVEFGIAGSIIVLGLLILLAIRLPLVAAILVAGILAIFHGHAHGAEIPEAMDAVGFIVGFVIATGLLHAVGIVIAYGLEKATGNLAMLRGLGACFAVIGAAILLGWL